MSYSALKSRNYRDTSDTETVANNAGGQVYAIDKWTQLRRFLVLGSEGGTYYVGQQKLTEENAKVVIDLAKSDPTKLVDTIVEVSSGGLAPKNDQALYALAIAASKADEAGRQYALSKLNSVARTATHLFQFVEFAEQFRGWGRSLKRAVANWYLAKSPERLAYQLVKYRQRNGWTHADVLRLAKPVPTSDAQQGCFAFATDKPSPFRPAILDGFVEAQDHADTDSVLARYGNLPWEAFPTERHNEPGFWRALINADAVPYTAMMRNLSRWTRIGVFEDRAILNKVHGRLKNAELVEASRVHPINVLNALRTYQSGRSDKGSSTWTPISSITNALDAAFYLAFKNVEPTGQRVLVALDVSGSMGWVNIAGMNLTPREGSAAMALATLAVEETADVVGFTGRGGGLSPIDLSPRRRLDDNLGMIDRLPMGGTDCSLPMRWAQATGRDYDLIVIYTDSETWAPFSPADELRKYRRLRNLNTKLVVVGMTASQFSIADPGDKGMLDVAGFDSSAPQVISNFARGLI